MSATLSPYRAQARETTNSPIANHLLCAAHGLSVALPASQLPAPLKRCSTIIAVCVIPGTWFQLLMVLREAERERVGRNAQPSAAIMDAASASKRLRNLPGSADSMRIYA